ncbi:casein kinase II, regulatory subunit [Pseudocercospora fijiensis CIRAD86]|uniref:Casein kinase II subunit beta n=1 Tax=Pseudocercospora fijiensis (strain CIRAD86) TaxID=383855 RepID=N1QD55_PSEFD|nr:casein kinase II, regulatory subunit [Pseudocercospora fijiensis CIRAD86]EME89793.1 casein kinase II, regulatory subunit [Pseudocercospora fijiensis CIRAD86]
MSSSSQAPESWISAFCSLVGHEYFAEVSEDFIEDDFNLTGLQSQVPMYKEALEMILDVEPEDASEEEEEEEEDEDDDEDEMHDGELGIGRGGYRRAADAAAAAAERRHLRMASDLSVIESSAEMLYGLIHQRFITSRQGIQQMAEKYELGHFGHCPRVFCQGAKVLPVGCSDIPGQETVKLFCPSCLDVYTPPNSRFQTVDGAFFGTTFGCLFFMTFPELDVGGTRPPPIDASSPQMPAPPVEAALPKQPESINGIAPKNLAPGLGPGSIYEPRIYGFRVSEIAKTGPRMKWLRSRPQDVNELDECRVWAENQEAMMSTTGGDAGGDGDAMPAFADSEMADDNEEIDQGEQEDQDMDARNGDEHGLESRDVAAQRRKAVNRRKGKHEDSGAGLVNGESSRSAVRVG